MDGLMIKTLLAIFAVMIMTSGCASLQDLKGEVLQARKSGEGAMKVYPVSADQAWDITEAVFRWEKTDELEENRAENYVITSSGIKMAAFGTVMGVWIEPADKSNTKLTVITKQRGDCCILTNLTAPHFFKRFEEGVAIVRRGGKLPLYFNQPAKEPATSGDAHQSPPR
jgi:uncharacterized protein YceK